MKNTFLTKEEVKVETPELFPEVRDSDLARKLPPFARRNEGTMKYGTG